MPLELVVLMPVYNEEECIVEVIDSWRKVLEDQGMSHRILVLNDGSKDHTAEKLASLAGDDRLTVINKPNAGHGPTILQGYHLAVDLDDWVFQCDSDDEMKASHFPRLWAERRDYDALFGYRTERRQSLGRKAISAVSRLTVAALFGRGVTDVNTPYRLMRSSILRQIIDHIPGDTFAPNVIIAGALARAKLRIANLPVPHEGRRTGTVSIVKWKLWKAAFRSFWQTVRCRPKIAAVSRRASD
jgi:glycosyltransferase involved in cell wall biosynthesis